ncbi:Acyl-CoA dehydrogenase [Georgfuchsia toluolica]|uniref:3-sulfinopropanoyl-CoA desulfinase n=1 Tax=Georgfuchsia toluolica TaxID=424218 RepID=A0A916NH12_9PROT|nr:acyl-CoA dehydrogenase family protein [Georgfuchsia toluolica]CAG4882819.1 Acyl-CoA dehydrogenase [Georgfuchsia toluolica]
MVDFALTPEQRALQDTARRFAREAIRPEAVRRDAAVSPQDCFPDALVRQGLALGLGNALIPEACGGYGGTLLDYSLIVEELAWGDAGIADLFLVNISLSRLIGRAGSEAQKQRWLGAMAKAERGYIIGGAMTEPSGGSEIFCPLPDPAMGVRTAAVRDGDDYLISGGKCFITNGGVADLYIVLARTDKTVSNFAGCSIFLVPAGTPGLSFGKYEDKMGHRLSSVREVFFDQVRVPAEQRLGAEGAGFAILIDCYEGNGVGVGSGALGLARAAYEMALDYAQTRIVWGQPIIQHESVAAKLAEMRMKIEAARALVWKIAWAAENPDQADGLNKLGTMAKIYPSAMVREVTAAAMDICGGTGYMRDFPAEKYVRDAMLYPIYDGTNDLLKRFLAQSLPAVPY